MARRLKTSAFSLRLSRTVWRFFWRIWAEAWRDDLDAAGGQSKRVGLCLWREMYGGGRGLLLSKSIFKL
jgi:hypothetical protein